MGIPAPCSIVNVALSLKTVKRAGCQSAVKSSAEPYRVTHVLPLASWTPPRLDDVCQREHGSWQWGMAGGSVGPSGHAHTSGISGSVMVEGVHHEDD